MSELNKITKVAYFPLYCPHYRNAVFSLVSQNDRFDFYVYSAKNYEDGFQISNKNDVDFKLIYTKVNKINIPLIHKELYFIPEVIKSIINKTYSVIILPNRMTEIHVWLAIFLSKIINIKIILWGHANFRNSNSLTEKLRNFLMKNVEANLFYTEETAAYYSTIGFNPQKLFVAYNSIDTNKINDLIKTNEGKEISYLKKNKTILFIGRLVKRKRLDFLISAFSEFLKIKQDYEWKLVIVGDGPELTVLTTLSIELKINDNIHFKGLITDEEIIFNYMHYVSFGIIPKVAGLMVIHFFSYGIPLIIGDDYYTHPPEASLVIDQETGLVYKDNDVNDLVNKMCLISSDEHLRNKLAVNAKKIIEEKYNVNNMAGGISSAIIQSI